MGYISNLAGSLILFLYNVTGSNYGLAIILFALIFKLLLMPLGLKSSRASQKQMELQPLVNEIQRKYKDNPEMQGRELQELYKKNNISLFGGCLPLLIQLPIIIAVFTMMTRPLTYIFKYDEATVNQLTAQVETMQYKEVAAAEKFTDINFDFFGINIGNTPQFKFDLENIKLWIFPLLSGVTTYATIQMAQVKKKKKENEEEDQSQEMMKSMNTITPLMSAYVSFIAPIGLSIYWIVGNIFQILQQKFVLPMYIKIKDKELKNAEVSYTVVEEKEVKSSADVEEVKTEAVQIEAPKEKVKPKNNTNNSGKNNNKKKGKKKK